MAGLADSRSAPPALLFPLNRAEVSAVGTTWNNHSEALVLADTNDFVNDVLAADIPS